MKTQHTPGPWTHTPSREQSNPDTTRRDIVAESQFGPAFIAGDVSQSEADLIASAPDMFDALQAVCDAYGDRDTLLIAQCKAALSKAKGEA